MEINDINFDTQEQAMKYCLMLAMRGKGNVNPNPRVGAVILRDGKLVSSGWHHYYGANHAEIEAINNAGDEDLSNATLYVNLEPCNHYGKTPPCTDAIIERKIPRVVVGCSDPNPTVEGGGITKLRDNGIEVIDGVLNEECKWINRFFAKFSATKKPYIIAKVAQSMDGCIATSLGQSRWISCEESRRRTHLIRSEVDAVLIGNLTASKDNSELTVRLCHGRNPKRIVLDTQLSIALNLKLVTDSNRNNTIILCSKDKARSHKADTLRVAGVNILGVPTDENNRTDIPSALSILAEKFNIGSILVEGGSTVYSSFAHLNLIDEIHFFNAPFLIGKGIYSFRSYHINFLNESIRYKLKAISKSGDDTHIIVVRV